MSTADNVVLRRESIEERSAARSVNEAAFERPDDEADLVDRLRNEGAGLGSFVAELEGRIVGHTLFSRMVIETADGPISAVALAPMAVLPDQQLAAGAPLISIHSGRV